MLAVMLVMLGVGACCRLIKGTVVVKAPPPLLLRSQDISLIQRSVEHSRFSVARDVQGQHQFKLLLTACIPDLALGHVSEIGSWSDSVATVPTTHFSSRAYAVSKNWFEMGGVRYDLKLTNDNWTVIMFSREN